MIKDKNKLKFYVFCHVLNNIGLLMKGKLITTKSVLVAFAFLGPPLCNSALLIIKKAAALMGTNLHRQTLYGCDSARLTMGTSIHITIISYAKGLRPFPGTELPSTQISWKNEKEE
jgi:hypothetical protein